MNFKYIRPSSDEGADCLWQSLFYCAKARLVIELDGGGHYFAEKMKKDEARTRELENMNLTVLRICNLDIDRNFFGVCKYIDLAVKKSFPQSGPLTAPSSEGAKV